MENEQELWKRFSALADTPNTDGIRALCRYLHNVCPPLYDYWCETCGGSRVQHTMWVSLNTHEIHDEAGTWNCDGQAWCDDCQTHIKIGTATS